MRKPLVSLALVASALAGFGVTWGKDAPPAAGTNTPRPEDPVVVVAPEAETAVKIAADEFAKYWRLVTDRELKVVGKRPATGRAVVIGAAPEGTSWGENDSYVLKDAGETLRLAGKNGRSTLYAVYEFFRLRAGCAWFWDGDVVPKAETVDWRGLDVREESRFEYRGLRYFAHRGLTRFQAEHWGLDDWKREIDWAVKSRLNLIMLRIGQDDVFQKAFPDLVPYPDPAKPYEWGLKGFDDRSLFWSLQERGALRKQVMDYAFARGLLQPEDFGTMSHWYARTPKAFLEKAKPDLLRQPKNSNYDDESGLAWDVRDDRWRDAYWKLTETSIREYGRADLLHTIGLGERRIFTDPKRNFDLKVEILRRMTDKAAAAFPESKILLAGWDFYSTWKSNEVQALVKTLDPKRFVIWDYEADAYEEDNNFTQWGFVGKIPYVFGTFLCYEQGLDIRANYERIERRWAAAANDPCCKGWIFWPESSHTDIFFLKYFTDNAWRPDGVLENDRLCDFSRARYGKDAQTMAEAWSKTLPVSQTIGWWGNYGQNMINWEQTLADGNALDIALLKARIAREALPLLATVDLDDPLVRRDVVDLARTILDRTLNAGRIRLWRRFADWRARKVPTALFLREIDAFDRLGADMVALLGQHTDYSLWDSLERLKAVAPVANESFDRTLLQNAANGYCRSHQYEVAAAWYQPLIHGLCDVLRAKARAGDRTEENAAARSRLCDGLGEALMTSRLADLRPTAPRTADALRRVLLDAYAATALVAAPPAGARLTFPGAPSLHEIDALAKGGADLAVAFLGCPSAGQEALRARYPNARWHFFDIAADGAAGVFRLDRDVLAKQPDLVILGGAFKAASGEQLEKERALYEAMIRRCLGEGVAVLPVAAAGRELAAHYGLPCAEASLGDWDRLLREPERAVVLPDAWQGRSFTGFRLRAAGTFDAFAFRGGYVGLLVETEREGVAFETVIDGVARGRCTCEARAGSPTRFCLLADDLEPGRRHTVEICPVPSARGTDGVHLVGICTAEGYGPDEDADETAAIQGAIDAAWRAGGGRVEISAGLHPVKGLRLRSNVELHLQSNAVLRASRACGRDFDVLQDDALEPLPAERLAAGRLCRWRALFERGASHVHPIREPASHWYNAVIRLYGATNAKITGEPGSAIDGCDGCEPDFGECFCRGVHGITAHFTTNFVLRGVELRRTGNWATCFHDSADLVFEDCAFVDGYDGVHVRGCDRIRVSRCDIRTGDDCVAGFDNSDVLVEDCLLASPANGFRLGGTHVRIRRCRMKGPAESPVHGSLPQRIVLDGADYEGFNRPPSGPFFAFLSDVTRNVRQEPGDIVIEDCEIDGAERLVYYDLQEKHPWQVGSAIRDMTLRNVKATNLREPSRLLAMEGHPVRVTLENVRQTFVTPGTEPFVSAHATFDEKADAVIVGSTPAGLTAAVQLTRMGKKAIVLSPTDRIGGMTTAGLGRTDVGRPEAFGGLAREFYRGVSAYATSEWSDRAQWCFSPSAALRLLEIQERREGLDIRRGERLDRSAGGVTVGGEGRKIVAVRTERGKTYRAGVFIDATYEGDLMAAAGVSFALGRESNATYGETCNGAQPGKGHHALAQGIDPSVVKGDPSSGLLPGVESEPMGAVGAGDRRLQAYCYRLCLTDVESNRVPFAKPAGYDEREYEILFRHYECGAATNAFPFSLGPLPEWKCDANNTGGVSFDWIGHSARWPEASYAERETIAAAHKRYQQGLLWTLANHPRVPQGVRDLVSRWGLAKDEFADSGHWPQQIYVREARRLVGDYVMTEQDCLRKRLAPRPVACGAYQMDSHHCRRYVGSDGFVHNEGDVQIGQAGALEPYGIDYLALVPKRGECANLLVPVCLSASHIAYGSLRMEPVFFALGQAAGTAASLALDAGCAVQDVDYGALRRRLVADGQALPAVKR